MITKLEIASTGNGIATSQFIFDSESVEEALSLHAVFHAADVQTNVGLVNSAMQERARWDEI